MSHSSDLVLASDRQLARSAGVWTQEKLFYLERYCTIFSSGMRNRWQNRIYIDLFSGPGRYVIRSNGLEVDGSALIASKCDPPFTHLFFNDVDANVITALQARMAHNASQTVQFFNLDCNVAAREIGHALSSISSPSQLALCFIDPTNWQIDFNSVAELTKDRRMDLIVVFHSGAMKRAAHTSPDALSDFFGDGRSDPEWRRVYDQARSRRSGTRALLDYYEHRLRSIGYQWFNDKIVVERDNDGVPLYQMVFASKHDRGDDFWGKISGKRHDGQMRLKL